MSSLTERNLDAVVRGVLSAGVEQHPELIQELLRQADAFGNTRATTLLLDAVAKPASDRIAPWQFAALGSLLDGLDRRRSSLDQLAKRDDATKRAVDQLAGVFTAARSTATDASPAIETRLAAVRLLGRGPDGAGDLDRLAALLTPQTPAEIQSAAVATLGRLRDPSIPDRLLKGWFGYGPAVRVQILELLSRRADWLTAALARPSAVLCHPARLMPLAANNGSLIPMRWFANEPRPYLGPRPATGKKCSIATKVWPNF